MPASRRTLIKIVAAILALALAGAAGWWLHKGNQKRVLQQDVLARVQDATARLREAIVLLPARAEARAKLEASFAAIKASVEKLQASNVSLNPPLVYAADAYVTDVQSLLRRQLAMQAGREAVHADIAAIDAHLRGAGARSQEWFRQALELKQRLDKSYFEYRVAEGSLQKSLRALRQSRRDMAEQAPAELVLEQKELFAAEKRLTELAAQLERQFQDASRVTGR